jgi:hypothetical protein
MYNFYSSGEEVLASPTATTPTDIQFGAGQAWNSIFGDSACGERSWVLQEKLKGRTIDNKILGSNYGGWGFNAVWDIRSADQFTVRHRTPAEAVGLEDAILIANPFFFSATTGLHISVGSDYAASHANVLLAEMIPARTLAAGANKVIKLDADLGIQANFDLTDLENSWPNARPNSQWLHSDLKDVGFTFTWKVFDRFSTLSELR